MSQPVTTPGSSELVSKLEELSRLASQIVRFSDELQAVSKSDFLVGGASVCALLPFALSNAQSCLSLLQLISQTPVSPPYCPPFFDSSLLYSLFLLARLYLSFHPPAHPLPPPLSLVCIPPPFARHIH